MFGPRREQRNNSIQPCDSLRHKNFNNGDPYFGSRIRKETENYENYMKWNGGGLEFRPDVKEDEHGICSPPLWEKQSAPTSPVVFDNVSLNLSPTSRREAVNRGRLELMEMVKAMPESSYELSLKDLVDNFHKPDENVQEECLKKQGVKKVKRKPKIGSNYNNENNKGLFLKMVLPLPFGGSSKKKVTNPYARVMSKPGTTTEDGIKCADKEYWWKKRCDENESGGSSGSSHSSGSTRSQSTRKKFIYLWMEKKSLGCIF
ncbi:uncharacterized protein LOC141720369 isoform X2 [Apium graveolens]|uniref:uncharacterized protein LOC141720369 isoform X2 n=1 Tax=Apium graveolens TaxID=4045 RepID=UPI003D7A8289